MKSKNAKDQDDLVKGTNEQTSKVSDEPVTNEVDQKVVELEKKVSELNDLLRLQVANERNSLRRRDEVERDLRKYGAKELGQLLIPELELLKKVVASGAKSENRELQNYLMGFEMVIKKIGHNLEEVGIVEIPLKVGDRFNEQYQEAIEQIETDEFKPNTIVEIVNQGYMIHDKVLVHAKVKIAGSKEENANQDLKDNEGEK